MIRAELVGQPRYNGNVVKDLDCLAMSPDKQLYAISTYNNHLYTLDVDSAELTHVMDVTGHIEGCAFGPSGTLYGVDNEGRQLEAGADRYQW